MSSLVWSCGQHYSYPPCPRSDFLETLDEQTFLTADTLNGADTFGTTVLDVSSAALPPTHSCSDSSVTPESSTFPGQQGQPQVNDLLRRYVDLVPPVLPSAGLTEKFLLAAADPAPGTRVERLEHVIRTKYEAGLLKPFNYVKGYARLSRWMDCRYVDFLFQKAFTDVLRS